MIKAFQLYFFIAHVYSASSAMLTDCLACGCVPTAFGSYVFVVYTTCTGVGLQSYTSHAFTAIANAAVNNDANGDKNTGMTLQKYSQYVYYSDETTNLPNPPDVPRSTAIKASNDLTT